MDKRIIGFLGIIVILAAALRFSYLNFKPLSLNWDEVSHGYNAYSVMKTGMDQWGERLPILNFRAYGDYPTALNLYLTIPFIFLFGLSEFSIRLPHALLGVLTIVSVYSLTWGVTRKKNVSLLASLLVSVGPWYFFTSQFVLQSNLSVFLLITAGAFFVNRERNKLFLPLSLLTLFLTLFSYHTTRIFSPLLLLGAILIYRDELKNKLVYIFSALFIILSALIFINPASRARGDLLFLIDQGAVNRIIESRNASNLPSIVKRLLYNRPVYFTEQFLKNYVSYFSPQFLFLKGGTQYQFSVPGKGLIYPINLPFFYIGLILLLTLAKKEKNYRLILLWLILSPIPASLTNESFTVIRATTMLPIPEILISMGFFWAVGKIHKNYKWLLWGAYFISLFVFTETYLSDYGSSYKKNYAFAWQYGYKEVVAYAKENYQSYDKIIVTKKYGEPHEYFLFFLSWNPSDYQTDPNKIAFQKSGWFWVDRFDKFYFVNDWDVLEMKLESGGKIDCSNIRCLLITGPNNYPPGWKNLKTVNFLDGSPAFEIYENN